MPKVFISYRRDDVPGDARGLRDALASAFDPSNIFMDVDNLLAGQRFDDELAIALSKCDVLIAVIGARWLEILKNRSAEEDTFGPKRTQAINIINRELDATSSASLEHLISAIQTEMYPSRADLARTCYGLTLKEAPTLVSRAPRLPRQAQSTIASLAERDYVRAEITAALERKIKLIPVLIGREGHMPQLPRPDELPADIRDLVRYQTHNISHERFGRDASDLVRQVRSLFATRDALPSEFLTESSIVRQVATEARPGWEFALTAELLGEYMRTPLQKWRDLAEGVHAPERVVINEEAALSWFSDRMNETLDIFGPLEKLTPRFAAAWGPPGQEGDALANLTLCRYIRRAVERGVEWEERVRGVRVPDKFVTLYRFLPGVVGSQVEKLGILPKRLIEINKWAETHPNEPQVFREEIVFNLSDEWAGEVMAELARLRSGEKRKWWRLWW